MSIQTSVSKLYDSDGDADEQVAALTSGEVPIGVYGLGKMGLPLAAVYAETTGNVTGADVDADVVETVNAGESHVVGEPGLDEAVERAVDDGALSATTSPSTVAERASVHVVIVPTLVREDNTPDLAVVEAVTEDIASGLEEGDVVIYESTLPPRSCRDVLLPALESGSGLSLGDFGLAFCPERTSSGRALEDIRGAYPKVVGGADEESTRVAELIYGELSSNEVIPVSDTVTAEAVKVFEGVYRDVNIALANELAKHTEPLGIDVTEAIDVANTQPFCEIHTPGVGVGGHCIPYYPHFLIQQFDTESSLLETARAVNESMPPYTVELALDSLQESGVPPQESTVLVMGLTYRAGVEETRKAPALPVIEYLDVIGADVVATDPILDDTTEFEEAGATVVSDPEDVAGDVDAVVLVTAHETYESVDVPALGTGDRPLTVVDGRQALTELRDTDGVDYHGVGLHD